MIDAILRDSSLFPHLFHWKGALSIQEIRDWQEKHSIVLPEDLIRLWTTKGGGDLFESETILQPHGTSEDDLVDPVTHSYRERGMPPTFWVFHRGWCISVFRTPDLAIITLSEADLKQISEFPDLDEWYMATLKREYADRYGLSPAS